MYIVAPHRSSIGRNFLQAVVKFAHVFENLFKVCISRQLSSLRLMTAYTDLNKILNRRRRMRRTAGAAG